MVIILKKFLIIILALLSLLLSSCSSDEDTNQNNGVVYYTAKTNTNSEAPANSTELNIVHKNEAESTGPAETTLVKINDSSIVYVTPSGKKYHFSKTCPGKNAKPITLEEAITSGRDACKKCTD